MKISRTSIYAIIPLICTGIFWALGLYYEYQILIIQKEPRQEKKIAVGTSLLGSYGYYYLRLE